MARAKRATTRGSTTTTTTTLTTELEAEPPKRAEPVDSTVDRLLERVSAPPGPEKAAQTAEGPKATQAPSPGTAGLRTARIVELAGGVVKVQLRGQREPVPALVGEGVDRELVALAKKNRDAVLVEVEPGAYPVVVGVVQTRIAREVVLKGETVTIEAEREVLLRAGRAAVRLREDGDVEIVGSRIVAMSRGLFRLVGRMLRLN